MQNYEVKTNGTHQDGNNTLYKLRITELQNLDCREIRVRYSTLYELHQSMQNENNNHQFPKFPQKDYFKSIVGQDQNKTREQQIGKYFQDLSKNPPMIQRSLLEFLREGYDWIKYQQFTWAYPSKQEFLKRFEVVKKLSKGQFSKSCLIKTQNQNPIQKLILHRFYVTQQEYERLYSIYQRAHLLLQDECITEIKCIIQIRPKVGLLDSIFGNEKPPKLCKRQPFSVLYPRNQIQTAKIYSIESYEGISLEEAIKQRQGKLFSFDEILNLAQKILQGLQYLHRKNINHNRLFASNIIINGDIIKITGIQEPSNRYKEAYVVEGAAQRTENAHEIIYFPPEKLLGFNTFSPTTKIDVWQFGICLLKACHLLQNNMLSPIINDNGQILKLIMDVNTQYGGVIAGLLECSLKPLQMSRADVRDLLFMSLQTNVIPFYNKLFNIEQNKVKNIRKTVLILNELEIAAIKKSLEKQNINILKIDLQIFDATLFDQLLNLLGNFSEVKFLTLNLSRCKDLNFQSLVCSLHSLTQLKSLTIDVKNQTLDNNDIDYFRKYITTSKLEKLIIDGIQLDGINIQFKIY
ncbi:Serine/threonine-protein kinase Nek3 [Paramecium bursaria]